MNALDGTNDGNCMYNACEEDGGNYDYDVSLDDVVARMDAFVEWTVAELASGKLPTFEVNRRPRRRRTGHAVEMGEEANCAAGDDVPSSPAACSSLLTTRSLVSAHQCGAETFARVYCVLEVCRHLVASGRTIAPRELYYRLKACAVVRSLRDVELALADVGCVLRLPRASLGIVGSSKGLVGGRLVIHDDGETDCSVSSTGVAIPGDMTVIARMAFQTDATILLVVEKQSVFQQLLEEQLWLVCPCILVTARGMPDYATRAFVQSVQQAFPKLAVVGLVDWNPSGVAILAQYRFGSRDARSEARRLGVPALRWAGVRGAQLLGSARASAHLQALTRRDAALALGLAGELVEAGAGAWADELAAMTRSGAKAEMEALVQARGLDGFLRELAGILARRDWV